MIIIIINNNNKNNIYISGWWLTYPSEKYDVIPNIWYNDNRWYNDMANQPDTLQTKKFLAGERR